MVAVVSVDAYPFFFGFFRLAMSPRDTGIDVF